MLFGFLRFHALTDWSPTHYITQDGLELLILLPLHLLRLIYSSTLGFCSVGDWNQEAMPARQVLHPLSYISSLYFRIFITVLPWTKEAVGRWNKPLSSDTRVYWWSQVLTFYPSALVVVTNETLVSLSLIMGFNLCDYKGKANINIKLVSVNFEEISTHFICGCF